MIWPSAAADPEDNTTGGQRTRPQVLGAVKCHVHFDVGGVCDCGKWLQHKAIITVQRSGQGGIEGFLPNVGLLACGRRCGLVGFSNLARCSLSGCGRGNAERQDQQAGSLVTVVSEYGGCIRGSI